MKTPIRRLDSLTHNDTAATKLINDNFEALQQGVEDALSRSGKKPNFMDDVLDMNMHRIINIADPVDDYDLANKHYVDTKVSEEETRAKAVEAALQRAIDDEETARIAGDNALRRLIDDEKTARQNADNDLRRAIGAAGSESIYSRGATYIGTDIAEIDVSDIVEDGVAYVPIVTTAVGAENKEARKTLNSICWYYKSQKKVQLLFTDNTYQSTNNIQYGVTLIPTNQSYTGDGIKGITDGLDNLGGSGGGSDGISIRSLVFEDVAASEPTGAVVLETSVSDYVADGQDYMPIYIAWSGIEQIDREIIYNPTQKCVSVIAYHTNGTSHDIRGDLFLIPVERKDTYSTLPSGYTNGLYVHRVTGFLETTDNLVTSVSSTSTDNEYPSAKCVYDALQNINVINSATGYDATKTQILKNVNGILTWVDEV